MLKVGKTVKIQRNLLATSFVESLELFLRASQTIGIIPPIRKCKKSVKICAMVSRLKYSEVKQVNGTIVIG